MSDLLVNHFYAHPVGHVVEALYYANGHRAADPQRSVSVALNATSPTEMARWCDAVDHVYPIDHPLLEPVPAPTHALDEVPRTWDWIVDDHRRHESNQLEFFPGMRDYYEASDRHLHARVARSVVGSPLVGYRPHTPLRLRLPARAQRRAEDVLGPAGTPTIAVLPGGSSPEFHYPSSGSWLAILDAVAGAIPGLRVILLGRTIRDSRTSTSIGAEGLDALRSHDTRPVDAVDLPLADQLALVQRADVFCSPHSGFGMAALVVGTPWLTISGGQWFEYWFNHVPFRSIVPDTTRYPAYAQFGALETVDDDDDDGAPRLASMTRQRVDEDLGRIAGAAVELLNGEVGYEQALTDYVRDLVDAHGGDTGAIWSIDGVHTAYL